MRYHSLDFWRGVACLIVIVHHSTSYRFHHGGGPWIDATGIMFLGVQLFFVISGYCIAVAAQSCADKGQSALTYFSRRFRRIYPPYWVAFLLLGLMIGVLDVVFPRFMSDSLNAIPRPWWLDGWQVAGNLTLTETWRHHVAGTPKLFLLIHAWTLCYEEQFYAVLGLIVAVAPKRLMLVSSAVTAAVVVLVASGYAPLFKGFFFDGYWLQFAAGILVHAAINRGGKYWALGILAAGLAWQWHDLSMATAFGFAILLILLHPVDRQLADCRWTWPVSWCGTMCYSLYLVHWPLCKAISHATWLLGLTSEAATMLITVPVCLAVSVAAGYAFHVLVERRFLNAPLRVEPRPVPACTGIANTAQA